MPIALNCHACGQLFRVKDELGGKRVKCSKCGQALVVPVRTAASEAVTSVAAKTPSSAPAREQQPVRPPAPAVPRIALQVGSLVAVGDCFALGGGWSLLGSRQQLPLTWLRRLIYDRLGWVGLGMFLDDALASILYGAASTEAVDAVPLPASQRIPPGAAAAVQLATASGFLMSPIVDTYFPQVAG